jgi:hypothetical protein
MAIGAAAAVAIYTAPLPTGHRVGQGAFWSGAPLDGDCALGTTTRGFGGGTYDSWTPACGPRTIRGTLYVAGDSHAEAFTRMLTRYAAETGTPVVRYYRPGCDVIGLFPPTPRDPECAAFSRSVRDELVRRLRPDDVLFLPGLRVPRLGPGTGTVIGRVYTPAEQEPGYREALATLRAFSATGAALVLEAPPPLFRAPLNRCMDRFNRHNPVCRPGFEAGRTELLSHRATMVGAMTRLASAVPRLYVWDPFPILCPGDPCSALRGGFPLYTDVDHLSGRGNDLLYPDFLRMTVRAAGASEKSR